MSTVKQETLRGIKWGIIQKCTMQPVQFIYGIILARLITPAEMGILGLTAIFFAIANQLKDCGFGMALIRKQDRTDADICTVFWFNIVASLLLSIILFLAAPWFASFFNQPALLQLTRVSALLMFLHSTGSVHWTLYTARRDFKTPAIVSMITTLVAMPFTIWAAFAGWSYWAPVLQGIISGLLGLITIWIISPWKPKFIFSTQSLHTFFGFGSKLLATNIMNTIYENMKSLLIGRMYSPADLGLYNRAWGLAHMPRGFFNGLITSVSYPILATLQHDDKQLWSVYSKYIRSTSIVIFFASYLLTALAAPFIRGFYGPNWDACIPYAQLILISASSCHFCEINSNLLIVKNKTETVLRLNIIHRICSASLVILACFHSVMAICWAAIGFIPFGILTNAYYTKKLFGVSLWQQLQSFLPYFLASIFACAPGYLLTHTDLPSYLQLLIGITSACYLYHLLLRKDDTYQLLLNIFEEKLNQTKWGNKLRQVLKWRSHRQ